MKKFYVYLVTIIAVVSLAGNGLLFMRYSSQRPLIDVNNEVIRRKDLDDRLDFLYSNKVLREMILNKLIMQEAARENCIPTNDEIDQEKATIIRTEPQVINAAYQVDPTLTMFNESLDSAVALRNIRIKSVTVSQSEVEQYYKDHQQEFRLPRQATMQLVYAVDQISASTAARMLQNGVSLNVIANQSGLKVVGINTTQTSGIPQNIVDQITSLPQGAVSYYPVGPNYVVVQIKHVAPAGVPPLTAIWPKVEESAKLAKAPTENAEMAKLVSVASIKAESDKYAGAIPQLSSTDVASAQ